MRLKRQLWQWRGVAIAAPTVAVVAIALRFSGLLQVWELGALDLYFRLRPLESKDDRIVIVTIDEPDLRQVGQWPIPDAVLAQLLEKIKQQNPIAIGLDLYRDLPVQPGHDRLVQVYESTPNLIGIKKVVGDPNDLGVNPPPQLSDRDQISANDLMLDADGKVRRGFIYLDDPDGSPVFSLSFTLAVMYLEYKGIDPQLTDEQFVKLDRVVLPPFEKNDGAYVGADAAGYQLLLNYRGPSCRASPTRCPFKTVSMTQVLEDRIDPNLMRDRIVLIGSTAESLKDLYYTPYSSGSMSTVLEMAGVEIHAHLISQIVSAVLNRRSLLQSWPDLLEYLWIFAWSCVGAVLSWKWRYADGVRHLHWQTSASLLLAAAILLGSTYWAFLSGWWIPIVPPLLGFGGSAIAIVAYVARTASDIRKAFGRYLNDGVVASLLESPEGFTLGGEHRKVTILMSDLRGFTSLSKPLPPEKVVTFLNIYLEAMADVITYYNGTIDKFIGDAIMVIFGAPNSQSNDAERAVACAVAMQLAMKDVNEKLARLGLPVIEMGIGIHTGMVVVGNIGSTKHASYTAIGSPVNLASRIESYTVGGQILISEATLDAVGSLIRIDEKIWVQPKGFDEAIPLYDISGIGSFSGLFLPREESNLLPLEREIPIHYTILDGKHVGQISYKGSFVKLSLTGAELRSTHLLNSLNNLKLDLLVGNHDGESNPQLYAKVVKQSKDSYGSFIIRFTSLSPDVTAVLRQLCKSCVSNS